MIDVIDQSWVFVWSHGIPERDQVETLYEWLQEVAPEYHERLQRFPPMCLVRGTSTTEVPFPFSVGIVVGYLEDGRLLVRQEPSSADVPVQAEELTVVGFWCGLSPDFIRRMLPKRKPVHAQHP